MKSRLFTDTQGLDVPFADEGADRISICLRMSRSAYIRIAKKAERLGITTGEYVERLILQEEKPCPRNGRRAGVPVLARD